MGQSSQREWSRWDSSDIDGQTREGENSGKKANQAVRDGRSPKGELREEVCVVATEHVFQVFPNVHVSIGLLQFVFATFRDAEQEDGVEINGTDVFFLREFFALDAEAALLAEMIS